MNTMKKVLAIVVAAVMLLSMAVLAFADDSYSITITSDSTGHTFKAYQILKGTVTGTGSKSLGDPAYGKDVDGSGLAAALKIADAAALAAYIGNCDTAALIDFAATAAKFVSGGTALTESPNGTYKADLPAGYYLVVDETELSGAHDANSRYILAVVTDVEVTAKIDYPDVEKDVLDYNDSVDSANGTWGKSADYDIGDDVEFRLTGTIPDTTGYKTYYYAFHDTMDDTFGTAKDFKVTVGGIEITTGYEIVTDTDDGCSFEVVIKDLISVINSVKDKAGYDATKGVVVTYTAELLDTAIIYNPGQDNEVYLEFSNNPNYTSDGSGEPGDEPDEPPTGTTEKKKVVVFTYDVTVNKVDANSKAPITGAEFTLEKFVEGAGSEEYEGKTGAWVAVDQVEGTAGDKFQFTGLDDGYYRLTETKAPEGYNKLAQPIYFEVSAEHTADGTTLAETEDFKIVGKSLSTDVENNTGATLPETGGIGTTLFYIVGGLMVLVAGVLLITKRRIKNVD
ncbi:MAG: isopeptide-forming domain-containing fimbrial protein [Oscillospiraceae bacterium]|nr:isopeptide-forming domain-containing fimbrial protein [Oscillospiraceae bacterium]